MNMFRNLAVMALVVGFIACGDDSSTGSPTLSPTDPAETNESSSSLRGSSSSLSEAEVNSSETAKSSSSDGSASSPTFSSSVEGLSSSVKVSSSSVNVSLSSSQNQLSSSSSSVATATSSGSYINDECLTGDYTVYNGIVYECVESRWVVYVERSSSSVAPAYNPLSVSPLNPDISYGEFVDPRDNVKYATLDIDNKNGPDSVHMAFTIFAQSLAYHDKVVAASEEQDDPDKVEMYCFRDSVEYCMDWYGGLYQWAEAMALPYDCNLKSCKDQIDPDGDGFHQGICPDGWHIMKEKELRAASFVTNIIDFDERIRTLQASVTFSGVTWGSNKSGLSMVATGTRSPREKKVVDFRGVSYAWYADEDLDVIKSGIHVAIDNHPSYHTYSGKDWGLSVRCVKNY